MCFLFNSFFSFEKSFILELIIAYPLFERCFVNNLIVLVFGELNPIEKVWRLKHLLISEPEVKKKQEKYASLHLKKKFSKHLAPVYFLYSLLFLIILPI